MELKNVKNSLAMVALAAALGTASVANAALMLDQTSAEYMGTYVPPEPASPTEEVGYVNILKGLAAPTVDFVSGGYTYNRSSNTLCSPTCPDATVTDAVKDDSGSNLIDLGTGGFDYLIGKYDGPNGGGIVWYVAGLTGEVEIPTNAFGTNNSQFELSHWSLYNPGGGNGNGNGGGGGNGNGNGGGGGQAPEPATVGLIGLSMLALGALRRRQKPLRG